MTTRLEREKAALNAAEKRLQQATVRRDHAAARLRDRQRKAETRAKIILGGALLALARKGHNAALETLEAIWRDEAPKWPEKDRYTLKATESAAEWPSRLSGRSVAK